VTSGTGRIDDAQAAPNAFLADGRRDPVGTEDHGRVVRHLVELVDEDRALLAERLDHEPVVDDLAAHVDRRLAHRQRQLDDVDRALDAGAKSTRPRQEDLADGCFHKAPCFAGIPAHRK
jgi:hypothetical protein